MDYIWTPWRHQYIKEGSRRTGCIFCEIGSSSDDKENLVVFRGESNYIVLNRFPYTSGHAMVVPYRHLGTLEEAPAEVLEEMIRLAQRLDRVQRELYQADGINLGMNIGKAAGAGVAGHIHLHVLPRWVADSNFMTIVGETRVLPEELSDTWKKLRTEFVPSSS